MNYLSRAVLTQKFFLSGNTRNSKRYTQSLESYAARMVEHICKLFIFGYEITDVNNAWRKSIFSAIKNASYLYWGDNRRLSRKQITTILIDCGFSSVNQTGAELTEVLLDKPDMYSLFRDNARAVVKLSEHLQPIGKAFMESIAEGLLTGNYSVSLHHISENFNDARLKVLSAGELQRLKGD